MKADIAEIDNMFQHTAARRRLLVEVEPVPSKGDVSTHSRAKAAA